MEQQKNTPFQSTQDQTHFSTSNQSTTNDEYLRKVRESFYKKIRNTNWEDGGDKPPSKPRGRKPKAYVRPESRPRSKGEEQAAKNKFFNFD